jgi:signal transduction histidine kinase
MNWSYAYTPIIWPSVLTLLLVLFLAIYSWLRRSVPGAVPFMIYCQLAAILLVCKIIAYLAVDFETKVFWFKIENAFWMPVLTAMTCFALEYAQPGRWLTRRSLALLGIAPLAVLILLPSNGSHHLLFQGFSYNGSIVPLFGPVGLVLILYSLGLTSINAAVFIWLFIRSPQHRWPVAIMLTTQIMVRALSIFDTLIRDSWFLYFPEVGFTIIACSLALFGFHIFDPIHMGRQTAIEQMQAGMLVVDVQGQVASLNPAAERILAGRRGLKDGSWAKGQPIRELLPATTKNTLTGPASMEIDLGLGDGRVYTLDMSPLKDWRGQQVGRLLMLQDVTDQKLAQAKILEQQRALAMLQERERLARELHDELAQELTLINLQAQLVSALLDAGQADRAREELKTLAKAAREANVDVRAEISGLSEGITQEDGLLGGLQHFAEMFQQKYGIRTDLVLFNDSHPISIEPRAEVQLLRIVQEAFTNIRKHAGATHVQVALRRGWDCMELTIEDNGVGFDIDHLAESQQTFGLGIMSERAAEVGGRMAIDSAPARGTRIVVEVPIGGER